MLHFQSSITPLVTKHALLLWIISLSNHGFQHKAKVITANIYPSDSKITLFLGILCESDWLCRTVPDLILMTTLWFTDAGKFLRVNCQLIASHPFPPVTQHSLVTQDSLVTQHSLVTQNSQLPIIPSHLIFPSYSAFPSYDVLGRDSLQENNFFSRILPMESLLNRSNAAQDTTLWKLKHRLWSQTPWGESQLHSFLLKWLWQINVFMPLFSHLLLQWLDKLMCVKYLERCLLLEHSRSEAEL